MLHRLLKTRFVIPAALVATVGLGGVLTFAVGAGAQSGSTGQEPSVPSQRYTPGAFKPRPYTAPVTCKGSIAAISYPGPTGRQRLAGGGAHGLRERQGRGLRHQEHDHLPCPLVGLHRPR